MHVTRPSSKTDTDPEAALSHEQVTVAVNISSVCWLFWSSVSSGDTFVFPALTFSTEVPSMVSSLVVVV